MPPDLVRDQSLEPHLTKHFISCSATIPNSVSIMRSAPHESRLVQQLFDFMLSGDVSQRVIGDKAYDSDRLDEELAEEGIEMIAPHQSNRRPENQTQDGRPLRRYKRRWTLERTIPWIQHFRRLWIRWENSTSLFQGFFHLESAIILASNGSGIDSRKQNNTDSPLSGRATLVESNVAQRNDFWR